MVKALSYGRCGNALYQIACSIGYADKHGLDFTVHDTTTSEIWNPLYCQHLINPNWNPALPQIRLREGQHEFAELPFSEEWRHCNIIIDGYMQSNLYFNHCIDKVRDLMGFKWEHKPGIISLHVRRGDYLILRDKHPYVSKEWMEEAMRLFPGKQFKFFSDDISWCRQEFGNREDCLFSTNKNEVEDLEEMSSCESHICSSSTFSIWGYNLNRSKDKIAVFPKKWFNDGYGGLETKDIVPPECIKL